MAEPEYFEKKAWEQVFAEIKSLRGEVQDLKDKLLWVYAFATGAAIIATFVWNLIKAKVTAYFLR